MNKKTITIIVVVIIVVFALIYGISLITGMSAGPAAQDNLPSMVGGC